MITFLKDFFLKKHLVIYNRKPGKGEVSLLPFSRYCNNISLSIFLTMTYLRIVIFQVVIEERFDTGKASAVTGP